MSDPVTIQAEERDLLRCRIWIHTSRLDRIWLDTSPGPTYSDQEAQQIREEMEQILDGLGRRKTLDEGPVALRTPPDVLGRVFEFMLHMAGGKEADQDRDEAAEGFPEYEDRHIRSMCGRVLAQLEEPRRGHADRQMARGSHGLAPQWGLGKAIRSLREEVKMTQATLAHKSDVPASWLSRIEQGEVDPTWATVERLSKGLGVSIESLAEIAERFEAQKREAR